jgi:dTDP-4-dehydrorhamnose reductase
MTNQRKLMVMGANGFVAGSVLAQAGEDWQVHAVSRREPPARSGPCTWHTCDPLLPAQLEQLFREVKPAAVIHTAALADVDICQANPELARAANVDLTRTLVDLCGDTGARLVFCSTDTIFDGEHAPYREEDPPGPVNVYAQAKVDAEQAVSRLGAQGVIARLSLVVGLPVMGAGNSFVARMIASLKAGQPVGATEREVRTPVDVITVGRALLELAAGGDAGIIHLAGHDRLSRYQIAQKVAARFGFSPELIVAQPVAAWPGRAARPRDVSLHNAKACAQLKTPMLTLDEGLSLIRKMSEAAPV